MPVVSKSDAEKLDEIHQMLTAMHEEWQAFRPLLLVLRDGSDLQVAGALRMFRAARRGRGNSRAPTP